MAERARVGPYALTSRIAVGGMGEVWEAEPTSRPGERVALKLLHPAIEPGGHEGRLFLREGRIGVLLDHPAIARALDLGVDGGRLYLAFDLLRGRTLAQLCPWPGPPVPPGIALGIALPILDGLRYAHREAKGPDGEALRVVHRDLKPSNLFLTEDGQPKIIDFGIAVLGSEARTLTRTGLFRGTLAFTSPEQLQNQAPDERSDLFSLGLVLFGLLAGRRVFDQATDAAVVTAILFNPIPRLRALRPEVPPALDEALAWALQRERERRPASAAELAEALSACLPASQIAGAAELAAWYRWQASAAAPSGPAPDTASYPETRVAPPEPPLPQTVQRPSAAPPNRGRARPWLWPALGSAALAALALLARPWEPRPSRPEPLPPAGAPALAGTPTLPAQTPAPAPPPPSPEPTHAAPLGDISAASPERPPAGRPERAEAAREPGPVRVPPSSPKAPRGVAPAFLSVQARSGWGKVFVDGAEIGITPLYRAQVPAGRHSVEVVFGDGSRARRSAVLAPNREQRLLVDSQGSQEER